MNCTNCIHSKRRLHYLGWRLVCKLYKRPVTDKHVCIDWRHNGS